MGRASHRCTAGHLPKPDARVRGDRHRHPGLSRLRRAGRLVDVLSAAAPVSGYGRAVRSTPSANWCEIRVSLGDYTCPDHGIITPNLDPVPHCAEPAGDGKPCLRLALLATARGHAEGRPATCSEGHPYRPGEFRVGTSPCPCARAGHHRTWYCRAYVNGQECADVREWPP